MTKEEATNKLISMYALYHRQCGDPNCSGREAIILAVTALAESAGCDHVMSVMRNIIRWV